MLSSGSRECFEVEFAESNEYTHTGTPLRDNSWAHLVVEREDCITSVYDNFKLKHDLIGHIWKKHGL